MDRHAPSTVIVRQRVAYKDQKTYENWLDVFHHKLKQYPCFASVDVVRRDDGGGINFLILATFETSDAVASWLGSESLRELRQRLDKIAGTKRSIQQVTGKAIWFDDDATPNVNHAPYWKRVLISIICVYPLLAVLRLISDTYLGFLSINLLTLLNVSVMAMLLAYPVMPLALRLSHNWLFERS